MKIRLSLAAVLAMAVAASLFPASGSAATLGQIGETWGQTGTALGQFREPGAFGVDPVSGDVYTADKNATKTQYRIQKFTKTGTFQAAAEIPHQDPATNRVVSIAGLAVDPIRKRAYAIESCRVELGSTTCSKPTGVLFAAVRIHAFETTPSGTTLPTAGVLALPTGADELYSATSIAVDPTNGNLVLLGEDAQEGKGHVVVERVTSTGEFLERFVDTGNVLKGAGMTPPKSLALAPDGTIYMVTGGNNPITQTGAGSTRAWQLPEDLSKAAAPTPVPGFAADAEAEGWPLLFQPAVSTGVSTSSELLGPGIAVSLDGSTLYWMEKFPGSEASPEGVLVRGYSLTEHDTRVLYGGGASRCQIASQRAGIGVTGEGASGELLAFAYGPEEPSPQFGSKVLRFGQGGDGCPVPLAKFSVNNREENGVTVSPGESVNFDASNSELAEGGGSGESEAFFPKEYIWKFGDGQQEVVECQMEANVCPLAAKPAVTHVYATTGEYTVTLEIKLETPIFGNPPPVQHTVIVKNPSAALSIFKAGTGSGTVKSTPAGIDCGSACSSAAAEFEVGKVVTLTAAAAAGSEFKEWSGACGGTGGCTVTMSEAASVTARFDLEEGAPPPAEFPLSVRLEGSGTGTVKSTPAGIDCGGACEVKFATGEVVTLSEAAAPGSEFAGWSGACTGTGACQVMLDELRSVGASFALAGSLPPPSFMLSVIKAGSGSGTVLSSRTGIYCGLKCAHEWEAGKELTLTATPASGSTFAGWSGARCAGTGVCDVTVEAPQSVTATFNLIPPPPAGESSAGGVPQVTSAATSDPPTKPRKPPSAKQKALRHCRNLKSVKRRAKCLARVNAKRKQPEHRHGAGS